MARRVGRRAGILGGLALLGGALAGGPDGHGSGAPAETSGANCCTEVDANGNAVYDQENLNFDPARVRVRVGRVVRWTNRDPIAPHTATENHRLWHLGGDYGSPFVTPGFGPGESRPRAFEAGTHRYFCEVHPEQMRGTVAVPVTLTLRGARAPGRGPRGPAFTGAVTSGAGGRTVVARWAPATPARRLVFDVQRKRDDGPWESFRQGTRQASASFAAGAAGTVWRVRARLRRAGSTSAATGWSPIASIRSS